MQKQAATGGTVYTDVFGFYVHMFSTSDTLTVLNTTNLDVLLLGGGGGGSGRVGGGGGAGAAVFYVQYAVNPQNLEITVGAGGKGGTYYTNTNFTQGSRGGDSSIESLFVAKGGGYGGFGWDNNCVSSCSGASGGCGGGGGGKYAGTASPGGSVSTANVVAGKSGASSSAKGRAGGNAYLATTGQPTQLNGGGGGGAGAVGAAGGINSCGVGGDGVASFTLNGVTYSLADVFGQAYTQIATVNESLYYVAGGGGGGGYITGSPLYCLGGRGGGGAGCKYADICPGTSGKPNTGSGGGSAGFYASSVGGSGGSGLVLVRSTPVCSVCPAGTYSSGIAGTVCILCTAGSYSNSSGASVCQNCLVGQYSTGQGMVDSSACVACMAGTFSTGVGVSSCQACSTGQYSSAIGASACQNCSAGWYSTGQGMVNSSACGACWAGAYSVSGASVCVGCPAGQYSTAAAQGVCKACPGNAWSAGNTTTCKANAGYYDVGNSQTFYYGFNPAGPLLDATGKTGALTNFGQVDLSGGYANISQWNGTTQGPWSQYLSIPTVTVYPSFTGCWWHQAGITSVAGARVWQLGKSTANVIRFEQFNQVTQTLMVGLNKAGATYQWVFLNPLAGWTYGVWTHVCVTVNSTGMQVYVNGSARILVSMVAQQDPYQLPSPYGPFVLTGNFIGAYQHRGLVDDVRLFNSTLTATEAAALYSQGFGDSSNMLMMPCPPGAYGNLTNATSSAVCVACGAGTYTSAAGQTACVACAAGTYSSGTGVTQCTQCLVCSGNGTNSSWCQATGGTTDTTVCACNVGYSGDGKTCAVCPAGTRWGGVNSTVNLTTSCGVFSNQTCSAWVSSAYSNDQVNNGPLKVLDGSRSTGLHSACNGNVQYFAMDFGRIVAVSSVTFWDRYDCCYSREDRFQVYVSNTLFTGASYDRNLSNTLCYTDPGGTAYLARTSVAGATFACNVSGRYLYIVSGQTDCFHFNEVQILGAVPVSNGVSSTCVGCLPGTYTTGAGATTCQSCVAGQYSTATGATVCTACAAGYYSTGTGVTTSAACVACAAGNYQNATGGTRCSECPVGTYSTAVGATMCQQCGAGTVAARTILINATSQTVTVPGYYQATLVLEMLQLYSLNSGWMVPYYDFFEVPPNTAQVKVWTPRQVMCPYRSQTFAFNTRQTLVLQNMPNSIMNFYVNGTLSSTCAGEPGVTLPVANWPLYTIAYPGYANVHYADFTFLSGLTACSTCPAGTYTSSAGGTSCVSCAAGAYSSASGASGCTACSAGTYSTGTGVTVCALCGWATYTTAIGANSSSVCTTCSFGMYQTGSGWPNSINCKTCAAGNFVSNDKSLCLPCVAGKYSTASIDAEWRCSWCQAGTYSTGSGMNVSATCVQCSAGMYSTGTGMQTSGACVGCIAGTYSTGTGMPSSGVCVNCAAGTYSTGTGMSSSAACLACSAGLYSTGVGATSSAACSTCAAGTYSGFVGATGCSGCPSNAYSASGSSACVANAGYYDIGSLQMFYYAFTPAVPLGDSSGVTGSLINYGDVDLSKGYANISQWNGTTSAPWSQYLEMPPINVYSSFTACWWHNPWLSNVGFQAVLRLGWGGAHTVRFFQLATDQSGRMGIFRNYAYMQWGNVNPLACWTFNVWQHVCLAVNATSVQLYCNRTARTMDSNIAGQSPYDLPSPYGPMYQGTGNYIGEYGYKGLVDDVRLFNATLSAYEVGALFDQGFGNGGRTLVISCPAGTYSTGTGMTSSSACVSCAAGSYSTAVGFASMCPVCPGGTYQPLSGQTSCLWCPSGSWCASGVANTCPLNTQSAANSSSQNQCLCVTGYFGNGSLSGTSPCALCFAGQYCPGGNNNVSIGCPSNSSSPAGASNISQCQCLPGYYGPNGTACPMCPSGAYCASGNLSVCPANSLSPAGSYDVSSCVCVPGFYGLHFNCTECPVAYYCSGGQAIQRCTDNATTASVRSWSPVQCYCDRGFYGVNNSACVVCPAGYWCWTGVQNQCPVNSLSPAGSSYMSQCLCTMGYQGPNGGPCQLCAAGAYSTGLGFSNCSLCLPGRYSTGGVTECALCNAGTFATGYGATASAACPLCARGTYCVNGTVLPCPTGTTGPQGLGSQLGCTCLAGWACQSVRSVRVTVRYDSLADSSRLESARLRLASSLGVGSEAVAILSQDDPGR